MTEAHSKPPFRVGDNAAYTSEGNLIDVRRVMMVMRERWLGAIALAFVVSALVGWVLLRQTPVYATTATLLVERSSDRVVDIKQVVDNSVDSSLTDALLQTHIQQIRSHTFLARVISSLTPEERTKVLAAYPEDKKSAGESDEKTVSPLARENERLEYLLDKGLETERSGRTLLIMLAMRHRDPQVAQFLANRMVEEYIAHLIDRSTASNDSALVFLNSQAEELRRRVEEAEQKVQAYRERHNLFFVEQNQNVVSERLRSLSSSVTQARVQRLALDAHVAQAEAIAQSDGDTRSLSSLPEFVPVAGVQRQLDELRSKRDVLAERYGRNHPLMQENATSLETLGKLRKQQIAAALADMRNQRDKALTDEKQLGAELATTEKESLRYDQLAVDYNFLRREVDTTRESYGQILARLNETTISSRLQNTNIKFVDRAGLPNKPVEPNRLKIFFAVFALGGLVLVGYPLAADALDTRIKSWFDVETYLNAPFIGEIRAAPGVSELRRSSIVTNALDEEVAEGFRALYNQLQLSSKLKVGKTILVTSTVPSEGKSFVASNLGASFAAHGRRTLLIDADFRRPSQHRSYGIANDNGILRWLASGAKLNEQTLEHEALGIAEVSPGLFLLPSGGDSRKLTELLESRQLLELLQFLKTKFDVVLIDTSPAGVFPDAEACCSVADDLVYVCRFATADRLHVRQTLDRLRQREINFLGVVLNGMPAGRSGGYHLSGWGHGRKHYKNYYTRKR